STRRAPSAYRRRSATGAARARPLDPSGAGPGARLGTPGPPPGGEPGPAPRGWPGSGCPAPSPWGSRTGRLGTGARSAAAASPLHCAAGRLPAGIVRPSALAVLRLVEAARPAPTPSGASSPLAPIQEIDTPTEDEAAGGKPGQDVGRPVHAEVHAGDAD